MYICFFFFSSRRRHTRLQGDWSSDVCSSDLRTAHRMLDAMGMQAFAGRARGELLATGETARKRAVPAARPPAAGTIEVLTAQEAQVARLARGGLSNPEIGARLFISPRTAQYHLSNVFTKLGISSRGQLHRVLPSEPDTLTPPYPPPVSRP